MSVPKPSTPPGPFDRKRLAEQQVELLQMAEGYLGSQVLFSLNELEVFGLLAEGPHTAEEVAAAVGGLPDPTERLLNAGVALGLLRRQEDRYINGEAAADVLLPGRPGFVGNWIRWMARLMRPWTGLTEAVRTGRAALDSSVFLGGDDGFTRDFTAAMDDYAQLRGSELVRYLDLSEETSLLDLGCGPGAYAALLARRWPHLRVTLFDLPDVVEAARAACMAAGVGDRVTVHAGDYHRDELGEDFDVVFISDVLHQEAPDACAEILEKAHRALKPSGRIVIQGMFLNEDRVSPRWPVLHSLLLLLTYGGGRAYTADETAEMLRGAGFRDLRHRRMSLLNVNSLIEARRG